MLDVSLVVADTDHSPASRSLTKVFTASGNFQLVAQLDDATTVAPYSGTRRSARGAGNRRRLHPPFQRLSLASLLRHYMDITLGIFLKGTGLDTL